MKFFNAFVLLLVFITGMKAQISVVPTVSHLQSVSTPSAGAISLSVSGGTAPYIYLWSPGGNTTSGITGKPYGTYSVKVTDAVGDTVWRKYAIGYKVNWGSFFNCEAKQDTLIKTTYSGSSYAASKNTLYGGTDGWFEYVYKNAATDVKYIGFADSLSPLLETVSDIDYGFYCRSSDLFGILNGNQFLISYSISENSVLRIERVGDSIYYKVNGQIVSSQFDPVGVQKDWKIKAVIPIQYSSLIRVGCSFSTQGNGYFSNFIRAVPTIVHSTNNITNDGALKAQPVLPGTYSYTWQPGSVMSASLASKSPGVYHVSVEDDLHHKSVISYNLAYKVQWGSIINCRLSSDSLITNTWGLGSAISKNTLIGGNDGWFEYVYRDTDQEKYIGFLDSASNVLQTAGDIDYGFHCQSSSIYLVVHNVRTSAITHMAAEGALLRVERKGDTINWLMNGVIANTVIEPLDVQKNWKIKGSLYYAPATSLVNVGCSFLDPGAVNFANYIRLGSSVVHCSGPATNDGSIYLEGAPGATNTYTWQPGSIAANPLTSKNAGTYMATAEDNLHHTTQLTFNIGYKTYWSSLFNCTVDHDTLKKTLENNGFAQAVSKNTLAAGTDGWLEYVYKNTTSGSKYFGFTDSLSPILQDYKDIDYGFYCRAGDLFGVLNGEYFFISYYATENSILRIERVGDTIRYLVNRQVVFSTTDHAAVQKAWKIKVIIPSYNSSIFNIGCSFYQLGNTYFPNYHLLSPTIVHASGPGANDGSIDVECAEPYSSNWQSSPALVNSRDNLTSRTYNLVMSDTLLTSEKRNYQVGYKTVWKPSGGLYTNTDTLRPDGSVYDWRGTVAENTLAAGQDGWLEYVVKNRDHHIMIGFLDNVSAITGDYSDVDYGFFYQGSTRYLFSIVDGNWQIVQGYLPEETILTVERRSDTIFLKINHSIIAYSVNPVEALKKWNVKAVLHPLGGTKLLNVGCSFSNNTALSVAPVITGYTDDNNSGGVNLNISGGTPPYNVAWNNIKLPSSTEAYQALLNTGYPLGPDSVKIKHQFDSIRQNMVYLGLKPGKYPVAIYDSNHDSLHVAVVVGTNMDTLLANGLVVSHTSSHQATRNGIRYVYGSGINLEASGSIMSGQNLAVLSPVVSPLNSSRLEFEIPDTSSLVVGITALQATIPYGTDDILSKAGFSFTGSSYSVYSGNILQYTSTYKAGDAFAIENNAEGILKFYKNGVQVFDTEFSTIALPQDEFLYKVVLKQPAIKLINIYAIIPRIYAFGITGTVKDVTCSKPCSGSIDAIGRGTYISVREKYELYLNSNLSTPVATVNNFPLGNRALFANLCSGLYTVKFYYTYAKISISGSPVYSSAVLTQTFDIAYMPDWVNAVNVTISADRSLTKSSGNVLNWDAGASTENFLKSADDGWIEWIAPTAESVNGVGFNDVDQGLSITDIDYANGYFKINIGIFGLWKYFIKTHNNLMINSLFMAGNQLHPFVENQKFRLEKKVSGGSTTIRLLLNGALIDQFTGITATDYVLDVAMQKLLGTINQPRVSFGCGPSTTQYAVPRREADAGYYSLDGVNLKFAVDGEYTFGNLKFKVLNQARAVELSDVANAGLLSVVTLKPGDNRYTLDCSGLVSGYYTLELANEKNEKLYLRFKR